MTTRKEKNIRGLTCLDGSINYQYQQVLPIIVSKNKYNKINHRIICEQNKILTISTALGNLSPASIW